MPRLDVALLQVVEIIQTVDLLGDVGEDAFGSPVRDAHDVTGQDVGQGVGLRGAADAAFHIVVRDDLQFDLVLMAGVVRLDHGLGLTLQRGTGPQGDLGAVIRAFGGDVGRDRGVAAVAATAGGQRHQERGGCDAGKRSRHLIERHHVRFFLL